MTNGQSEKVDQLLGWVLETVKGSTEFVKEQAPQVAVDMVKYAIWYHAGCVVIAAAIWIAAIVAFRYFTVGTIRMEGARPMLKDPWNKEVKPDWSEVSLVKVFASSAFMFGTSLGMLIVTVNHGGDWLKATVAPRLYVLEECTKMIRGHR